MSDDLYRKAKRNKTVEEENDGSQFMFLGSTCSFDTEELFEEDERILERRKEKNFYKVLEKRVEEYVKLYIKNVLKN